MGASEVGDNWAACLVDDMRRIFAKGLEREHAEQEEMIAAIQRALKLLEVSS